MNNYGYNIPYGQFPNMYNQPNFSQPAQQNIYANVNGIEGAKNFPMRPNSTILLMDSDNPYIYIKSANAMGQATLQYFKITPISENDIKGTSHVDSNDYVSKKDFESIIERIAKLENTITPPVNDNVK